MGTLTAKTDGRGRLTLGKEFANKLVIVRHVEGGVMLIPAEAVPEREAWLHKNERAITAVLQGLDDAASGRFADSPDRDEDD